MKILIEESVLRQALEALEGINSIYSDSRGVAGYHLNGDIAEWGEFDEMNQMDISITALRAAIEAAEKVEQCKHQFVTTLGGDWCIKCNQPAPSNEYPAAEKVEPVGVFVVPDNPSKTQIKWTRAFTANDGDKLYLHPPSAEIEELERQLAECQRERDMLRKFHHDQQELHERNEANAQTNRLRLLQIVELRAACQMALDALESCINDPKMRHTDTVHYATQDAIAKLREVLK